jgi:hypothetical protein
MWQAYKPIYMDVAAIQYKVGDKVRIDSMFDDHNGMVGKILRHDADDDSYLVEFEHGTPFGPTTTTDWYHGTDEFVHAHLPGHPPKFTMNFCHHEWREDKWFTPKVFKTCKKCGAKYEDEF